MLDSFGQSWFQSCGQFHMRHTVHVEAVMLAETFDNEDLMLVGWKEVVDNVLALPWERNIFSIDSWSFISHENHLLICLTQKSQ